MATNIVTAVFDDCGCAQTETVFQYDYGQILKIEGIELPQSYEVHFSNDRYGGETTTQIGGADGVSIPDAYLQSGQMVYAFIFLHAGADDGETEYVITIPVAKRPEITDEVPTPVEQSAITQAIAALNTAVEQTAQDAENAEQSAAEAQSALDNIETALASKQDKLVAGANITIEGNVISATGGGGGGGAVDSVNGQTGDVVLDASDVHALPDSTVIPTKTSDLTNDSGFITSVPVSSVNGKTGAVVLGASDVGALPSSTTIPTKTSQLQNDSGFITSAPVSSVNGQTGDVSITAGGLGAYVKPSGGIPKTDLASAVQTSLGKADTALQTAPVNSVDGKTGTVTVIPTGGTTGQVLAKASATDRDVEWVDQSGGSSPKTAVIFAASDSADEFKESADYVCTGTNDQILINSAMEQNKEFVFVSGTYNISGEINPVSNSTLRGVGYPTFKLANRTTSNLSASASIGDSEIYVTDPSVFVLGQKIQIKEGNQYDQIGIILSIDTATGRITFSKNGDPSQTGTLSKNFTTSAVVFSDPSIVMGWSVENVTVEGIKLDGNRSNLAGYTSDSDYGSNAIEFYGGKGIRVCNNIITDVYKHGILFVYGTTDSVIENNAVSNCSTHGIDLFDSVKYVAVANNSMNSANIQCHNGSYSSIVGNTLVKCSIFHQGTAKYNTIVGNVIDNTLNNSARNFQFNGNAVNNILVANNVTYGGNYGIQIDGGRRISLIGNYFAASKSQAIHLYNTQFCNASDNDIDGCNATNTGAGILLEMTCLRNKISNNFIKGTSGKTEYGVQEKTSASNYNYINGNVAYNATAAVSALGTDTVETGNAVLG